MVGQEQVITSVCLIDIDGYHTLLSTLAWLTSPLREKPDMLW